MLAALPSNSTFLLFLFSKLSIEAQTQYKLGCAGACQREINQANRLTDQYHQKETSNHNKLLQRIVKVEHEHHDNINFHPDILRLPTLEKYVERNFTALNKRQASEFKQEYEFAENEFSALSADLDQKLKKMTGEITKLTKAHDDDHHNHHWHDTTSHQDVKNLYLNLSRYVDKLEYGKISYLTDVNKDFRTNFYAIKGPIETFQRYNCFCKYVVNNVLNR